MVKTIHGIIHGRTIELNEDAGMTDGQSVRVQLTPLPENTGQTNRLAQSAGALADEWTDDDDRILAEIHRDRKNDSRSDIVQ